VADREIDGIAIPVNDTPVQGDDGVIDESYDSAIEGESLQYRQLIVGRAPVGIRNNPGGVGRCAFAAARGLVPQINRGRGVVRDGDDSRQFARDDSDPRRAGKGRVCRRFSQAFPFSIPVAGADRYAASPLSLTSVGPAGALPLSLKVELVSPIGPVPVQSVWTMRLLSMTLQGEGPNTHWSTFTGASVAERSVPALSVWKTGVVVNKVPKNESLV
jgi:hypothetical protein